MISISILLITNEFEYLDMYLLAISVSSDMPIFLLCYVFFLLIGWSPFNVSPAVHAFMNHAFYILFNSRS